MSKQLEVSQEKTPSTKDFRVEDMNRALFDFEDLMERCLSPFVLLGKTAQDIKDGFELRGEKVEVGIETKYLTKEVLSTIESYKYVLLDPDQGKWTYEVGEVPVVVKLIKRKYEFLRHPQRVFYWGGDYLLPNPMEDYLKAQHIVQ